MPLSPEEAASKAEVYYKSAVAKQVEHLQTVIDNRLRIYPGGAEFSVFSLLDNVVTTHKMNVEIFETIGKLYEDQGWHVEHGEGPLRIMTINISLKKKKEAAVNNKPWWKFW